MAADNSKKKDYTPRIVNRRARHEYLIGERYQAGIVLAGSEVKSVRAGKVSLAESFARIDNGEVFLYNMNITPYQGGSRWEETDPARKRKLLLHRSEISALEKAQARRGLALVPLVVFFQRGLVKVEIGVGRGKTGRDKRDTIRKREAEREVRRFSR